jgi:hypothetical protein
MALSEADRATLLDNQFVTGGRPYAKHLPCDKNIYLGEDEDISKALDRAH